jgi:hypothetical protein
MIDEESLSILGQNKTPFDRFIGISGGLQFSLL